MRARAVVDRVAHYVALRRLDGEVTLKLSVASMAEPMEVRADMDPDDPQLAARWGERVQRELLRELIGLKGPDWAVTSVEVTE